MRYLSVILCLVCICVISAAGGQQGKQPEKRRAVVIPREYALPVIAQQPGCPLQFERVKMIYALDWGRRYDIQVRNRGSKPIRSYVIAEVNSAGPASWLEFRGEPPSGLLMPGQTGPPCEEDCDIEILPLTNEIREKLKLTEKMMGVMIFMVMRVEFADGSTYSDEAMYNALRTFFEENSIDPQPKERGLSKE